MFLLNRFALACAALLGMTLPAVAAVTVNSPANGTTVSSPFTLNAVTTPCSNQPVVAIAYNLDSNPDSGVVYGASVNASLSSPVGWHEVWVKTWGNGGALCYTTVWVNVVAAASAIPANAAAINSVQNLSSWYGEHDTGTVGGSTGWTGLAGNPSISGSARQMYTTSSYYGGERYATRFGADPAAHNFVYDGWIYIQNSAAGVKNLELDLNQVMTNGWTVIYGFQCDGWNGVWDYTANTGSVANPSDHWIQSSQPCNPQNWTPNTWHHVQIAYSRDDSGYVTYQYVVFDGNKQVINARVLSAFALGWSPTLVTNFQVDGSSSGTITSNIYLDNLTVYRW